MLFSYAIEGFLGWLSRFKLIRLQRISLATLPRYGRRGGCLYMYCLPPAGVLHLQNKVINAQTRVFDSRRRNHEWTEGWAEGWSEGLQTICTITMSVRG